VKRTEVRLLDTLASAEVFVDGDWVESKDQDPDGDVRLVQLADVGDGEYIDKSARFLTSAKARALRCTFLKPGDVMVARMPDPLGRACIFPGDLKPSVTVVDVCIIRPDPRKHDARWLMHCLNAPASRNQIACYVTGTTRSRISRSNLGKIRIPLPPLAEQRRIAEVLDRAEALRAKRRAALAQLDSLTQSLFLDLFGDPATNTKQFPTPQLAEAIELRGGFAFKSGDYVPDGIPLVRIGEVNRGGVTRENACFLPVTHEAALARFIVRPGDMLMSLTGTTGKDDYANVILLDGSFDRYFVNQRVALIEPKPNVLDRHYLLHVFRNPKVKARLTSKSRGIRQANISNGDVLELELPVPPISLQREFARRVTAVEKLKTVQRASLAELDALFASLQHRAFRGEL
jgi:type I restriction enzyme, S subunit